jgi:formyl-CoA transferase
LLTGAQVPHAPVRPLDEIVESPQILARHMVTQVSDASGREFALVGNPIHRYEAPPPAPTAPPDIGEHTDEVLRDWLGYDAAHIASLRTAGAIA